MCIHLPTILVMASFTATAYAQGRLMWIDQMTDAKRGILLNEHNRLRSLEPASNMQRMVWDSNLEALARARVSQCSAAHSTSSYRSRKFGFSYIGENIWWSTESRLRGNLDSIVMEFYREKPWYNFATTGCQPGQMCGHYTQSWRFSVEGKSDKDNLIGHLVFLTSIGPGFSC